MRFRRISFPISAAMSILAITLYFFHGLNFGIDFKGGLLLEVQTKAAQADLAKMRADARRPRSRRGAAAAVRRAQRRADPHRRAAGRRRGAAGGRRQGARLARQGRRSTAASRWWARASPANCSSYGIIGLMLGDLLHPGLSLVPFRMAVRARRHDRQRARPGADHRLHVADAHRFRPHQHRGAAHHSRLFAQRHRGHLRPHPRNAAPLQAHADGRTCSTPRSTRPFHAP